MMIAGLVWHFIDSVAGSHIPPTHPGLNLSTRLPCFGQTSLAVWWRGQRIFTLAKQLARRPVAGAIGLAQGTANAIHANAERG